jgi:siderophore synthetase component
MRAGFSLEIHAQNTLLQLGADRLNEQVLFRDLEGVVFSDRYRRRQGLPALFANLVNEELLWTGDSVRR